MYMRLCLLPFLRWLLCNVWHQRKQLGKDFVVESFFHSLKTELIYFVSYSTIEEAKSSIFDYIEIFYNRQRRHSTLNYFSPVEFENRLIKKVA